MSRLKLLVTNVGFFGGLKVLSSLFPLLILPYVTSKLDGAEQYGVYDMFIVVTSLSSIFAMLGIQEAMFRQYHLKDTIEFKKKIISVGFTFVLFSSIIISCIFFLLKETIQGFIFDNEKYYSVLYFAVFYIPLINLKALSLHPSRLENNKKHLLVNTILEAFIFYLVVIILLEFSFDFYSLIYGHFAVGILLSIYFLYLNRKEIFPIAISKKVLKQLLIVGAPLMPIFLIYWANNSIIRILIMKYLGASELGIFSIGSKYASISTFIQMAFAGGWSYFTFSTMRDKDQIDIKVKIFDTLLFIITLFYALITPLAPVFFNYILSEEYQRGYFVFGQLFLSPLFLVLYQIIANQFTIVGKSFYSLISLFLGFIISIILSVYLLEKGYGIFEISYSIPISYLIAIFCSLFFALKISVFKLKRTSIVSFLVIIIINLILLKEYSLLTYLYVLPLIIFYLFFNRKIIYNLISLLKPKDNAPNR